MNVKSLHLLTFQLHFLGPLCSPSFGPLENRLKAPNTKRFKRTLIYFNTDTQYANFRGNPLYQASSHSVLFRFLCFCFFVLFFVFLFHTDS